MSPAIHTAGFRHYGLPHTYEIHQTPTIEEAAHLLQQPSFGGASVTMPHKLSIGKYCDEISEHASEVGAVNTIIVSHDSTSGKTRFTGENTDWTGLFGAIKEKSAVLSSKPRVGLVIGAGGASRAALYALFKLGFSEIYIINRTRSTAESIAKSFKTLFTITVLNDLEVFTGGEYPTPDVIIGTIPADKTSVEFFPAALFAKPEGICVDMSYKPRVTPLLLAAAKYGFPKWQTVNGIDVLLEQGFSQFELWTGNKAPKKEMKAALAAHDAKMEAQVEESKKATL